MRVVVLFVIALCSSPVASAQTPDPGRQVFVGRCAGCHGTTVSRFPDEPTVGGDPAYRRILRVVDCSATPCAGVTDAALRLVTVVVTYRTPGVAGQATSDKAVTLEWLVTQR